MTISGTFPEIYKTNVLADPVPTGAFNPGSGYFANEPSSYRGGRRRKSKKSNKNKSKKNKTRKNRTRRNCK
jgi:hypothetical protein